MSENINLNQITSILITALQYIFGGIGLKTILQWAWLKLNNPLIEINDVKISRYPYDEFVEEFNYEGEIIGVHEEPPKTIISWRVYNKIHFFIFSEDIHDIYALYNFERVDASKPRDYLWASETPKWPMLSPEQDIPMEFTLDNKYLPNGTYKLRLNIMSEKKVLKSYQIVIPVSGFGQFFQ